MAVIEIHVADVCSTCKAPRDLHVDCSTRQHSVNLPPACTTRAECEKALKDAAKVT